MKLISGKIWNFRQKWGGVHFPVLGLSLIIAIFFAIPSYGRLLHLIFCVYILIRAAGAQTLFIVMPF